MDADVQYALRCLQRYLVDLAAKERELDALTGTATVQEIYPVAVQRDHARARVDAQRANLDALLLARWANEALPIRDALRAAGFVQVRPGEDDSYNPEVWDVWRRTEADGRPVDLVLPLYGGRYYSAESWHTYERKARDFLAARPGSNYDKRS